MKTIHPFIFQILARVEMEHETRHLPVFITLMTCRRESLYTAVFSAIKNNLQDFAPSTFMADFEMAPRNAVKVVFQSEYKESNTFNNFIALFICTSE